MGDRVGGFSKELGKETDQNILYENISSMKEKREWMINNVEQTGKPEWWAGSFVSAHDSWVCINGLEDLKYRLKGWWFSRMASESKLMFQWAYLFLFGWAHQYTNLVLKNQVKLNQRTQVSRYILMDSIVSHKDIRNGKHGYFGGNITVVETISESLWCVNIYNLLRLSASVSPFI